MRRSTIVSALSCGPQGAARGDVIMRWPSASVLSASDVLSRQGREVGEDEEVDEVLVMGSWLFDNRTNKIDDSEGVWGNVARAMEKKRGASQSPLLWEDEDVARLLKGSSLDAAEVRRRKDILIQSLREMVGVDLSGEPDMQRVWMESVGDVMSAAVYLPDAQCIVLLPEADLEFVPATEDHQGELRTSEGEVAEAILYDAEGEGSVVIRASREYAPGETVLLAEQAPRPSSEMLWARGIVPENNTMDYLLFEASILASDGLYMAKKSILDLQFPGVLSTSTSGSSMSFPIFVDRMPQQLLAFLRLSRIQDTNDLMSIDFERDTVVSQQNEYEVLMLMMAECRDRLSEFATSDIDEETRLINNANVAGGPSRRELSAARLRRYNRGEGGEEKEEEEEERMLIIPVAKLIPRIEKKIILDTMNGVRNKLAPIRGIPTKAGTMEDPNADLLEIFEMIEGRGGKKRRKKKYSTT